MTLESHVIGRPARYGLPHVGSEVCSVEKSGAGLGGGLGRKKKLFSRGYRIPSSAFKDNFTA